LEGADRREKKERIQKFFLIIVKIKFFRLMGGKEKVLVGVLHGLVMNLGHLVNQACYFIILITVVVEEEEAVHLW
jgi:hypothetical protein